MSPEVQIREKRRESRRPGNGVVHVRYTNPRQMQIKGRLIDVSPSGFRMAHDDAALAAGSVVEFTHSEGSGRARAMWNRIVAGKVETGFHIV